MKPEQVLINMFLGIIGFHIVTKLCEEEIETISSQGFLDYITEDGKKYHFNMIENKDQ